MPEDRRMISEWNDALTETTAVALVRAGNAGDEAFLQFCNDFSNDAPKVAVIPVLDRPDQGPAIEIRSNLRYRAIPAGPELGPFLDALAGSLPGLRASEAALIETAVSPVLLRLYIAERCPFCPAAVRRLLPLAQDGSPVDLTVIDAGMFQEDAAADGIRSVPTLVFHDPAREDRLRWTGKPNLSEILPIITLQDPSLIGPGAMEQMIQDGRAATLARMMLEKEQVFPAFIDLLTHEKWPIRLGAMVAAETLADESRKLGGCLIEPLWKRFHDSDETIQGDILYVLGVVGDGRISDRLASVVAGPYPSQVKEAAEDAVNAVSAASMNHDAP